jgi:uncharacterized membrane protein YkoI
MKSKINEHKKNSFKALSKKVILGLAIVCSASLFAQTESKEKEEKEGKEKKEITVPSAVSSAFAKDFPGKKAEWEMEGVAYEAEFKLNGSEASVVYDNAGNRKELEIEIKTSELPAAALQYVEKNYPTSKIKEVAKITDDKNVVTYEVEIKKEGKNMDVLFDAEGKFIKTSN